MSIRRIVVLAIALVCVNASCRDTTAPRDLVVALSVDTPPTPVITDTPNGPKITCNVSLTATASGKGSATWGNASAVWYVGKDRHTPVGTTTNDASDIVQGFGGAASISSGQTLHTIWYFYDGEPFAIDLGFAYTTDDGKPKVASTHFMCGPDASTAVVPTITQLTVPMSGTLQIGDTINVTYQATTTTGLWQTIVDASGGFLAEQKFTESLAPNVNRTVKFVVPYNVNLQVPMTFSVRASDAALETVAKSVETKLEYADTTPPQITNIQGPVGQYAVGDRMQLNVYALDNYQLGSMIYDIGPPTSTRDSLPAWPNSQAMTYYVPLTVRPEWLDSMPTISTFVRDAAGLTSPVKTWRADSSLHLYPVVTQPTSAVLSLSSFFATNAMIYDAKRDVMYVGTGDYHVVDFSPSTMTAGTPLALPGVPSGMELSQSGDSLLVAVPSDTAIEVFDLTNPSAAPSTMKLSVLDTAGAANASTPPAPDGLAIAANGKLIVMLSAPTRSGDEAVEVDLATGAERIRTDARELSVPTPLWTRYMGRSPDRSRIYFLGNCSVMYTAATDTFSAPCGGDFVSGVMGFTFDTLGTRFTRGGLVVNADLSGRYAPPMGFTTAISPGGSTLYLGWTLSINVERYSDKLIVERIPIPITAERIFPSPDGKWLLAFQDYNGARVVRVDLQ